MQGAIVKVVTVLTMTVQYCTRELLLCIVGLKFLNPTASISAPSSASLCARLGCPEPPLSASDVHSLRQDRESCYKSRWSGYPYLAISVSSTPASVQGNWISTQEAATICYQQVQPWGSSQMVGNRSLGISRPLGARAAHSTRR